MLDSFAEFGIEPSATRQDGSGQWDQPPQDLNYERVRFESMRSDEDEVFRFIWENRVKLKLADGAYTRVLNVRPAVRIGIDGFVLRETVAQYYQVARLTPDELRKQGIVAPKGYLEALEQQRVARLAKRSPARAPAAEGDELGDEDAPSTPLYGGGVLIFDEYGRLKYHVHNDVFGRRQAERLAYLWESGQLTAREDGARFTVERLSRIHRARALDTRRLPGQGW
jgi:hypothetical protein